MTVFISGYRTRPLPPTNPFFTSGFRQFQRTADQLFDMLREQRSSSVNNGALRREDESAPTQEQESAAQRSEPPPYRLRQPAYQFADGTLEVELPGVDEEQLTLEISEGRLELRADRSSAELRYALTLRLHQRFDQEAISATLRDGLLRISLPERLKPAPRRISIGGPSNAMLEEATHDEESTKS